jgi:hypothetical protein
VGTLFRGRNEDRLPESFQLKALPLAGLFFYDFPAGLPLPLPLSLALSLALASKKSRPQIGAGQSSEAKMVAEPEPGSQSSQGNH